MIRIENDVFDVAARLKEIDDRYVVFYNPVRRRYEMHTEENGRVSYQLTLPSLDCRAVMLALETRTERLNELAAELENENLKAEREEVYRAKNRAGELTDELLSKGGKS